MFMTGFTIENTYGALLALGAGFYQVRTRPARLPSTREHTHTRACGGIVHACVHDWVRLPFFV
jgi:hypothetical protein